MPSISPHVNSFSENKIQTFPSCVFGHRSDLNGLHELQKIISPTHKRTEGRAPVWGSEFTSKRRRTTGGDPAETAVG
jgi:hypothetical protein